MAKFNPTKLPRELKLMKAPTVRAEGAAVYLTLPVFSVADREWETEFEICLAAKSAQQLAADLLDAAKKVT